MSNRLLGNLKEGLIFIVSAPAGTGKTTLVQMLTHEFSCVVASVSYTTRQPRPGEVDGVHYHFVSEEEFFLKEAKGEFLETIQLFGNYYGTSRRWLEEQQAKGKHIVLVIDTQGAQYLKGKISSISIFISPPSIEVLAERLMNRQSESRQVIETRLEWANKELQTQSTYDYRIINDDLAIAYQVFRSIVIAEERRLR